MSSRPIKIIIDFDGTCVSNEYPNVGHDIGAVPILKEILNNGHKFILLTARSGQELAVAVKWFEDNEIPLHGIQSDPDRPDHGSPKPIADLIIDDTALGIPVIYSRQGRRMRFVDWVRTRGLLVTRGVIRINNIQHNMSEMVKQYGSETKGRPVNLLSKSNIRNKRR